MSRLFQLLFSLAFACFLVASPTLAQIPGTGASADPTAAAIELPEPLTEAAVREMVARMSDDQVRGMLLDRLDAVAAAETANPTGGATTFEQIGALWTAFYSQPVDAFSKIPVLITGEITAVSNFAETYGGFSGVLTLLGLIALVLAIGFAAEYVASMATKRWQSSHVDAENNDLKSALSFLFRRFMRELFGLVIFFIAIRLVGRAILTPDQILFASPLVFYLIWMPRLGSAISRFVLAPNRADLRLVNVADKWAVFLNRHLVGLIFLMGFTFFVLNFNLANGVPLSETRIGFWLDGATYVYIAWIAWTAREGLREMMLGTDPDRTMYDIRAAMYYPYYAIGVAIGMNIIVITLAGLGKVTQLLHGAHYITMFWLLIVPALDTLIRGLVRHLVPPMMGEGKIAADAYKSTKRSYIRIGRVLMAGLVIMLIANSWDVDLADFAATRQGIGTNIVEFLMTLAIGYIFYEMVSLWINRRLAKEQTEAEESSDQAAGEGGGAGGSRLATVLPLVRVSAQIGIAVIFSLLAIGSLGIDITPLLAGAGILGLAIGFGAQKLVSDIVSGIFFLVDDAFRVGEYVEVEGTMGTVEKISIRSMQLRHHRGLVHTIPYGEIPKLTNFSRDWVIMKLMFTVPFDTDPNKVKKIFKKIGAEMLADPLFKDDFLEPFKSQGVFQFDDVGIVMRGKFMAKPGTQFTIRKEIYNRVRSEFDANGIEFARREVRVAMPGLEHGEDLTDVEKTAMAAAAGAAVQNQVEQQKLAEEGKS